MRIINNNALLIMMFMFSIQVNGQSTYTVNGTIIDKKTGEVLIGATIFIPRESMGAISNSYGFYSITVPLTSKNFTCSYIGYESKHFPLSLTENMTLNICLREESTKLEEVIIKAEKSDQNLISTNLGIEKLNVAALAKVPVLHCPNLKLNRKHINEYFWLRIANKTAFPDGKYLVLLIPASNQSPFTAKKQVIHRFFF